MPAENLGNPGGATLPHIVGDDGSVTISALEGAMVVRVPPNAGADRTREFQFEVAIYPHHARLRGQPRAPAHFHPYQEEYFSVSQGALGVEIEGVDLVLRPGDGEFVIQRGVNHRLFFPSESGESDEPIRFNTSAERTASTFALDLVFFENWYGYQEEVAVLGKKLDMIQLLCMWDAGDSYLTLPWWIPFRSSVSVGIGVLLGRWLGGLLGYQPFYKCWTSDWELASAKIRIFQPHFVEKGKSL